MVRNAGKTGIATQKNCTRTGHGLVPSIRNCNPEWSLEFELLKRNKMRMNWMYGALLATAIVAPSSAQISVYIGTPPPPIRYEEYGPTPGPDFVWVDGYWEPVGHRYRWVRGRWDRPPYQGAYWSHPHYDHY